jgi:hypothetical protein
MTFNIGSQNAGQINNVAGDQTIYGGQQATITSPADALAALPVLREAIAAAATSTRWTRSCGPPGRTSRASPTD